jgi:hypothetical protein
MVRRADAPRGAADPVASALRTECCAPHRPQPKAPVYRGQRAPISSMLAPPVPYGGSSRFQPPRAKSASPAPTAMPPRRFPLDVREQNAVACLSTFIQARATGARQAAGGAHDEARGGSTEYGGVGKGMQLAAPGTDVHVTSVRRMLAAGGLAWRSGLGPDAGSHPGADKHTAAGWRPLVAAQGAFLRGVRLAVGGCPGLSWCWRSERRARRFGHRMAGWMVCDLGCACSEEGATSRAEGFAFRGSHAQAS